MKSKFKIPLKIYADYTSSLKYIQKQLFESDENILDDDMPDEESNYISAFEDALDRYLKDSCFLFEVDVLSGTLKLLEQCGESNNE